MKIGITGGTGFIGSQVAQLARERGHGVVIFSRHPSHSSAEGKTFRRFSMDKPPDLSGLDAVVNLAGEPIFGRWTKAKKHRIHASRVEGTRWLVQAMAQTPPRVLISGSAIGFYGDTGETEADETSPQGSGFLADVAANWEAAADEAGALGVRVVKIRTGFVLGRGGALSVIGPVFRLGLGGRLGSGRQWMSGIHVRDLAALIVSAAENETCRGLFNAVMPEPFRNVDFTHELARTLHRPAMLPVPAFALRLVMGEMADLMLVSSRVQPRAAEAAGFAFRFPTLREALQEAVG